MFLLNSYAFLYLAQFEVRPVVNRVVQDNVDHGGVDGGLHAGAHSGRGQKHCCADQTQHKQHKLCRRVLEHEV